MTEWRCKHCGRRVEMHYDHVGTCGPTATDGDCTGTFSHPSTRSFCDRRGVINLTHEMVEIREWTAAEEADES